MSSPVFSAVGEPERRDKFPQLQVSLKEMKAGIVPHIFIKTSTCSVYQGVSSKLASFYT